MMMFIPQVWYFHQLLPWRSFPKAVAPQSPEKRGWNIFFVIHDLAWPSLSKWSSQSSWQRGDDLDTWVGFDEFWFEWWFEIAMNFFFPRFYKFSYSYQFHTWHEAFSGSACNHLWQVGDFFSYQKCQGWRNYWILDYPLCLLGYKMGNEREMTLSPGPPEIYKKF